MEVTAMADAYPDAAFRSTNRAEGGLLEKVALQ